MSTTSALCSVCTLHFPIYTCPRCAIRTCSLHCSKSHKALQSCSGERDKTAYVPMNKYGWGTMANDYVYLEEVGRKTMAWGLDITKGRFLTRTAVTGRGYSRGRGRDSKFRTSGRGKRDVLKLQLAAQDIDMEMLPDGMEKRRLNQSTWDPRSKSPLMTIEFIFHPVKDPLAPSASPTPLPFTLLTHRNNLKLTIFDMIHRHVRERGKNDTLPLWVKSLVSSSEDNDGTEPVYLIAQAAGSLSDPISKSYHRLDSTQSTMSTLGNKTFVEYPTIEVWEDGAFTGAFVEVDGTYVEGEGEPQPGKRRRLDKIGGQKVINILLGGYKSEENEDDEEDNVLDMLGNYGSDKELEGAEGAGDATITTESSSEEGLDSEGIGEEQMSETFERVGEVEMVWSDGKDVDCGDSADDEVEELELGF